VKLERDEEVNVEHPSDAPSANPSDAPTENLRASFLGKGVPVDSRGLDFNFVVFPDVTDPVRCELKCGFDSAKGMAIDRKQKHCVCIWEGDIGEEETYPGNVGYFDFAFGSGEIHIDELQEQNVDVYPTEGFDGIIVETKELDDKTGSSRMYLNKDEMDLLILKMREMMDYVNR